MDFRINKDYFPVTGIAYSVNVSFLNVDSDNNDIYGMYLFDEDNKIVICMALIADMEIHLASVILIPLME